MRCPRCRCEVGERQVCPFCGATVYTGNTTWSMAGNGRTTQTVSGGNNRRDSKALERRIRALATKVDLMIVIQIGLVFLNILTLILLAIK